MNKSSSMPDMASLRRRTLSDRSLNRVDSTASLSSSPDSLVAHLTRGSSFLRAQQQGLGQQLLSNSTSQPQLRRNPTSLLELASILDNAAEIMDDYGNEGDEAISGAAFAWPPHRHPRGPPPGGPSTQ